MEATIINTAKILADLASRKLDPRSTADANQINDFMVEHGDKLHSLHMPTFGSLYGFIVQCIPHHIGINFYDTKNILKLCKHNIFQYLYMG